MGDGLTFTVQWHLVSPSHLQFIEEKDAEPPNSNGVIGMVEAETGKVEGVTLWRL